MDGSIKEESLRLSTYTDDSYITAVLCSHELPEDVELTSPRHAGQQRRELSFAPADSSRDLLHYSAGTLL